MHSHNLGTADTSFPSNYIEHKYEAQMDNENDFNLPN